MALATDAAFGDPRAAGIPSRGDAERRIRAIAEERGPVWTDYVIAVITECPYASSRGLQGMDGAVAIMRDYKRLLDEAVARFLFPRLVLSDCHRRWQDCHAEIREFLGLENLRDGDVARLREPGGA